ncbi:MAG: TniB family NTP-binding protein [Hydrogenophaga sp.]|uniref:TniB family NTP-binding protein n=1 Tax=Hydrogenophaga sp. TaxID=1904254 RepID=UPI002ABA5F7F|nr:TniB family NTP-binding protein [Hydrogenophaga sp.]MDZ4176760.1 TniB family NTP-binding protein [Hydrogenophaga sp.]
MNQAKAILNNIIESELPHLFFEEHLQALKDRVEDAMEEGPPSIDCVLGPSRVGKGALIRGLDRDYPKLLEDGAHQVPLLVVPVPSPATPKLLPSSVLKALGVPLPSANLSTAFLYERMARQLKLAKTRVILFDESGHIVDKGTKVSARAAGDWFKQLVDQLNVSVVFFGIPQFEKVLDCNEQLRYRCGAVMRFNPYEWSALDEQRQFAACVVTYAKFFEKGGIQFTFDLEPLIRNCYLLSGGLVGIVNEFMFRLAKDLIRSKGQEISFEQCASTAKKIQIAVASEHVPFAEANVPSVKLQAVHSAVLDEAHVRHRKTH